MVKTELSSLFTKPSYFKVRAGLASRYSLLWASAVIVKGAFKIVRMPVVEPEYFVSLIVPVTA